MALGKTVVIGDNGSAHSTSVSVSESDVNQKVNNSEMDESGEKFVSKDAYTKVSNDMHKYKSAKKELEAKINELQAMIESEKESKMREQEQWKELYEKTKGELDNSSKKFSEEKAQFLRSVKSQKLKEALGGRVKDIYLRHANLDAIQMNEDGTINDESLHAVANEFKESFPEVIPAASSVSPNSFAAPTRNEPQAPKSISDMSFDEKAKYLAELTKNR